MSTLVVGVPAEVEDDENEVLAAADLVVQVEEPVPAEYDSPVAGAHDLPFTDPAGPPGS